MVIISGVSGAGKTTASNILEDMGYRCIDQYPPELLGELIDLIEFDKTGKYENVAMTISLSDLDRYQPLISNANIKPVLLLIDASKDTVINRYKFTRRVHPLLVSNKAGTLSEAVDLEKALVEKYKNNAIIIDTTNLSMKQHRELINKALNNVDIKNLSISFMSFGFKNGVPEDCDDLFDVRFLDNPFYVDKLKKKTGNDKPVKEFVLSSKKTQTYLKHLIKYLDYMFKNYSKEDKRHLTICIGCTGGQHRSVVVANYLFEHYKKEYICYIKHREL